MAKYVILGAGMTGLSTAYYLKENYFLAEKNEKVGGVAGSIQKNGYVFDYAEHFLRLTNKLVEDLFKKIMKDNFFSQELISAIYFKKKLIPYAFQENIRELPSKELKKCSKSLISNYYSRDNNKKEFKNFEEFIYFQYGNYIADEFMIPYNEKIWNISTKRMNTSWFLDPNFIPSFNIDQIINSILPRDKDLEEKTYIRWYPKKGGSQALADAFIPFISNLNLNHKAVKIELNNKRVIFNNNHYENYDSLVSTIPLTELLTIIEPLPREIRNLSTKLEYNSVFCLNLCLNNENNHKYHWIYFPQKDIPFSRLFFSNNFSKENAPLGKGTISALATYLPEKPFNFNQFEEYTLQALINLNFLKNEKDIVDIIPFNIKYGFTLPTIGIENHLNVIQEFLKKNDIFSIGRYGEWKYSGIEHAIEDGKNIALKIQMQV